MNKATGDNSNLLEKIRLTELTVAGVCLLGQIIAMITIRPSDGAAAGNPPAIELGVLSALALLAIVVLVSLKREVRNQDVDFYWLLFHHVCLSPFERARGEAESRKPFRSTGRNG